MARRLIWTEPAWRDLEQAADYIAQDSQAYARAFVQRIRSAVESLERLPRSGRVVPEVADEDTRELLIGGYRVVYEVRDDALYVVRIVHGARHFAALWEDESD